MPTIEARTRREIAAFLPCAIQSALESYQSFSEEESTDPKSTKAKLFKEHHDACKVAIAHIELLIKLARWADLPDPELENEIQQQQLMEILQKGQFELDGGKSE